MKLHHKTKEKIEKLLPLIHAERWDKVDAEIERNWCARWQALRILREHCGIELPRKKSRMRSLKKSRALEVVAALLNNPGASMASIGEKLGASRQYVEQVKRQGEQAGIVFNVEDSHAN